MKDTLTWLGLIVFAIMVIVMGVQGSLGRVLAVVFVPNALEVVTEWSGGGDQGGGGGGGGGSGFG